MRIYKPKYRDRKSSLSVETEKWYVDFVDHNRIRRRIPAFTDKAQSKIFHDKITKLVVCRQNHEPPDGELSQWLRGLPGRIQNALLKFGLIDICRAAAGTDLSQHLKDFHKVLVVGNSKSHIRITYARIERIIVGCGFRYFVDIASDKVVTFLAANTPSGTTYNYYLAAFKHFCNWMVETKRAAENPVSHVKKIKVARREDKRPLTAAEMSILLAVAEKAPVRYGMSGHDRAVLYLLAAETGLRVGELRSLTVSSFDFAEGTVTAEAQFCKDRNTAKQLLKKRRAAELKNYFANKLPTAYAFKMPLGRTAVMLKADLQDAGIEPQDGAGRKVTFHSFRHTLATSLDRAHATTKEQSIIMRHSDNSNLTQGIYTHARLCDLQAAIENLPNLSWPGSKPEQKREIG